VFPTLHFTVGFHPILLLFTEGSLVLRRNFKEKDIKAKEEEGHKHIQVKSSAAVADAEEEELAF
jgi:hypothetical protein